MTKTNEIFKIKCIWNWSENVDLPSPSTRTTKMEKKNSDREEDKGKWEKKMRERENRAHTWWDEMMEPMMKKKKQKVHTIDWVWFIKFYSSG